MVEIKQIREKLGWSREKLASELGVSFFTVQKWELGKTKPSHLAKIKINELMMIEGVAVGDQAKWGDWLCGLSDSERLYALQYWDYLGGAKEPLIPDGITESQAESIRSRSKTFYDSTHLKGGAE